MEKTKTVIVHAMAGHIIHEQYLKELITKGYNKAVGAAFAKEGELQVAHMKGELIIEGAMEMQEKLKSTAAYFYFSNFPDGSPDEDMQPYLMMSRTVESTDAKGAATKFDTPMVVAFLEGECSGFTPADAKHCDEFFMAKMYLLPKVGKTFSEKGKDLMKMMAEFKDPVTNRDLAKAFDGRGTLVLLTAGGEEIHTGKNPDFSAYPWGWTSNHLGYAETSGTVTAGTRLSKVGDFMKQFTSGDKKVEPAAAKTDTVIPADAVKPEGEQDPEELIRFQAPKECKTNKEISNYYHDNGGFCPEGYKHRPFVQVAYKNLPQGSIFRKERTLKSLRDLGTLPAAKTTVAQAVNEALIAPEIVAEMEEIFLKDKDFKKAVDLHSKVIEDPTKSAAYDAKYPSWLEQNPEFSVERMARWPVPMMHEFLAYGLEKAKVVNLFRDLMRDNLRMEQALEQLEPDTVVEEEPAFKGPAEEQDADAVIAAMKAKRAKAAA